MPCAVTVFDGWKNEDYWSTLVKNLLYFLVPKRVKKNCMFSTLLATLFDIFPRGVSHVTKSWEVLKVHKMSKDDINGKIVWF